MIVVIHRWYYSLAVVCTSNAYGSKYKNDNGHSCIVITVVCTSNAYGSKYNNHNGHSCIDIIYLIVKIIYTWKYYLFNRHYTYVYIIGFWRSVCVVACGMRVSACSRESVVGKAAMRVWECVVGKTVPYESKTNGGKGWKDISVRIQYFVNFSQVCAHYWMLKKWLERTPSKYICTINNVKKRSTRWFHMSPKQMGGKAGKT